MIKKELQKIFLNTLTPALLLIIFSELTKESSHFAISSFSTKGIIEPVLFVFSAISALAAPVLFRIRFIKKVKDKNKIDQSVFYNFEKHTLFIVLITPYFFFIASLLQFSTFYYLSIFLFSLYGAYYYYPSKKRLNFEKRLFRIKNDSDVS